MALKSVEARHARCLIGSHQRLQPCDSLGSTSRRRASAPWRVTRWRRCTAALRSAASPRTPVRADYHRTHGGALPWEIASAYTGCCKDRGLFGADEFATRTGTYRARMIKTPQSANPGHGGLLPGVKVADRVEHLRGQVRRGPRPGSIPRSGYFASSTGCGHWPTASRRNSSSDGLSARVHGRRQGDGGDRPPAGFHHPRRRRLRYRRGDAGVRRSHRQRSISSPTPCRWRRAFSWTSRFRIRPGDRPRAKPLWVTTWSRRSPSVPIDATPRGYSSSRSVHAGAVFSARYLPHRRGQSGSAPRGRAGRAEEVDAGATPTMPPCRCFSLSAAMGRNHCDDPRPTRTSSTGRSTGPPKRRRDRAAGRARRFSGPATEACCADRTLAHADSFVPAAKASAARQ